MATSYRKSNPLDPRDILVFDQPPAPAKRGLAGQKVPEAHAPTALHEVRQIVEAINGLGKYGAFESKKLDPGESVTLSPRHAWIEDRGHIDAFNAVVFAPDMPTIQFIDSVGPSDDARRVEVWLQKLTPGKSYIAQIRVLAGDGGEFHIRTGEGTHQVAAGGDRTIPVLLYQVQRELSLITVTSLGGASYWAFVDATITAI